MSKLKQKDRNDLLYALDPLGSAEGVVSQSGVHEVGQALGQLRANEQDINFSDRNNFNRLIYL